MTDSTPTTDPSTSDPAVDVGGSTATQQININPATGQPYPPMGVPVNEPTDPPMSENPADVAGDRVYMSIAWMNVSKDEAMQIKEAALAATDLMSSYSVEFSTPVGRQ